VPTFLVTADYTFDQSSQFSLEDTYSDFVDNHITVSSVSAETGNNDSEVGATIIGENIKIGVNGKYLLDALSILGENSVMELNDSSSPIVIRESGNDGFVHVIMPMRAN